jgi:hypothetical protein
MQTGLAATVLVRCLIVGAAVDNDLCVEAGQGFLVAAGEACANAVEHAGRQGLAQLIRLTASVTADDLHLTVVNDGQWRELAPVLTISGLAAMAVIRQVEP